jgi:hypothetical protein
MRMLKPSPGEVADRTTILELKIEAAKKKGLPTAHFEQEEEALDQYLDSKEFCFTVYTKDKYYELRKELLEVNRHLWQLEDLVRSIPPMIDCHIDQVFQLARTCKQIATANDERAELVQEMNKLVGISAQEKNYNVQ